MRLFLDTSSLIKLYHEEQGGELLKDVIVKKFCFIGSLVRTDSD